MKRICSILLFISTCALMQVAYAQTYMTDEEMLSIFPGAKFGGISSSDGKTPWEQTYGNPKKGKWCENWDGGSACWDVEFVDETTIQMYKKGTKMPQVWKIIDSAS